MASARAGNRNLLCRLLYLLNRNCASSHKTWCVLIIKNLTIDDLFKKTAVAYENYAQRLAVVYEATRRPEDFISADFECKKMMKAGNCSAEDLRCYGVLHHQMVRYCIEKAIDLFDKVIERGKDVDKVVFWRTRHQNRAELLLKKKQSVFMYVHNGKSLLQ